MRALLFALAMGVLFGSGLIIAGMTDPANIKGFLDLAGDWRPALLAVLGTAVIVSWALFAFARRRGIPFAAAAFQWPTRRDLDLRLIGGSVLFGIGWALAGFCPGPALAALGGLSIDTLVFVPAMAAGMWIVQKLG